MIVVQGMELSENGSKSLSGTVLDTIINKSVEVFLEI